MSTLAQICLGCDQEFIPKTYNQTYCTRECYTAALQPEFRGHLSSATSGALSELQVCVDLLIRGYDVFRSVSPAASCDLVAIKDGHCLRVEVRTGRNYATGPQWIFRPEDVGKSDVCAVVLKDKILYVPDIISCRESNG